jgi:hypothetical protein
MTEIGGSGEGQRRRSDPHSLPDPSLFLKSDGSAHGRSTRRIVLMGVAAMVLVGGGALLMRGVMSRAVAARRSASALVEGLPAGLAGVEQPPEKPAASPEELAAMQRSWVGSEAMAPRSDRIDRETGERIGFFEGFGLQVDSTPPGARVVVNGEEMGTSPLLTTVDCAPGDEVTVLLDRAGQRARAVTRCREDTLVKLQLKLRRGR